ncbi:IS110 family transposase [Xenorhabdus nematophila]|nr:IS110 family transposase [Xenorhabdus nematophila]CEF33640.1 transposase [Xenorhabdus nematophila str. Websteri]AYA39356.1 IS110 family transposase [Xenorhabdus nematophila]KHD27625.1 transposase [Xenorhabdus nematophila]MBA0017929.1 IS110 family transposase [Xenorhabdus nematophila]MCB4426701.1 IS110 family transposase [Xenorhabdus nematophila]
MNIIKVVGIDLAKNVFQVCVWLTDNSIAWNKKVSRQKLLDTLRAFPPNTLIAMEACQGAHYWGRTLQAMGYAVRLIPTQYVKALCKNQKNDANDALAICETSCRPGIHFVPVKTVEQQDIKALRSARQLVVEQRTALVNQIRALLVEQGSVIPAGIQQLRHALPDILEEGNNALSFVLRRLLHSLQEDMQRFDVRIYDMDKEIQAVSSQQSGYAHLLTIPGVGPLIAAAFVSEVNAEQFQNGRQLSAWCGLVPRQYSSGGKNRLSGMTKQGNRHLRTLIIHGARAVMRCCQKREDVLGGWLRKLIARCGFMKATVALANKLVRIIWRILKDDVDFMMKKAVN